MKIQKHGFIHRNKIITTELNINDDVYLSADSEIFYGTKEEALSAGYTFLEMNL